jgi:hypothetical protein
MEKRKVRALVETEDGQSFAGEYVATASFNDRRCIAHGKDPKKVHEEARAKGYDHAVFFYVPHPDVIHCY